MRDRSYRETKDAIYTALQHLEEINGGRWQTVIIIEN